MATEWNRGPTPTGREQGTLLTGLSAGALCWSAGGLGDAIGLDGIDYGPVSGLGFLDWLHLIVHATPDCRVMTLDTKNVYLMDSGDFTKIGYSTDPQARLLSAQSGNPQAISLAGVIETNHAPRLEEKLHELLSDYRCEMGGGKE